MNKKTKKISIWIAMMLLAASFGACGEESVEQKPAPNDQTNQEENKDNENLEDSTGSDDNQNGEDNDTEEDTVKLATTTDKELSQYLLRVKDPGSELYGYVDIRTGEYALVPQFTGGSDAEFGKDGWARVVLEDKSKAVINTSGEYLIAPEEMSDVEIYWNGTIVVANAEKTKAFLYHDTEFVKELEIPEEIAGNVHVRTLAYYLDYKDYTSNTAVVVMGRDVDGESIYGWYDFDGNLCYQCDEMGNLIIEEERMYFYNPKSGYMTILDRDGSELEKKDLGYRISKALVYGDKWYMVVEHDMYYIDVYTNGLEKLFEAKFRSETWASMADSDSDKILAIAGRYYKPDGTKVYDMFDTAKREGYYGFHNGYAKIINSGDDEYGFIDMEGNFVLSLTADEINNYGEVYPGGLLPYCENGLWGIKDMQGNVIWSPRYPSLGDIGE